MSETTLAGRWTNPALSKEELEKAWQRARLQALTPDEKLDVTRNKIIKTCHQMHNILGHMVGWTQVAKRTAKYLPAMLMTVPGVKSLAIAADASKIQQVRDAFQQIFDIATAIAEPILWFYAVTACVMMVTSRSKQIGWEKLKTVGYAYLVMSLLPTIFAFLRWLGNLLKTALQF